MPFTIGNIHTDTATNRDKHIKTPAESRLCHWTEANSMETTTFHHVTRSVNMLESGRTLQFTANDVRMEMLGAKFTDISGQNLI